MGKQKKLKCYSDEQLKILDLEETYTKILWDIFSSEDFKKDLLKIETYLNTHYKTFKDIWEQSNKLKISFERVMRYHVYNKFLKEKWIKGIYPSPISGDMGFITEDAVINIDAKTIDKFSNAGDIKWLQYLPNQSNFDHINFGSEGKFAGFPVKSHMPKYYNHEGVQLPIITFFVKLIYSDNKKTKCNLYRNPIIPTLTLTCLPNGVLSDLFENELVSGVKEYKYHSFKKDQDQYYKPKLLDTKLIESKKSDSSLRKYIQREYPETQSWKFLKKQGDKIVIYDEEKNVIWQQVRRKKPKKHYNLEAVHSPLTLRIDPDLLKVRYGSKPKPWCGHLTLHL